jgi:hypothetical protein
LPITGKNSTPVNIGENHMWKSTARDWHDLSKEEQEAADNSCNSGKHGALSQEKGPGGGTGDYICTKCGLLKSGAQWRKEGLLK